MSDGSDIPMRGVDGRLLPGHPAIPGSGRPKRGNTLREIYEAELAKITKDVMDPETRQMVKVDALTMMIRQRILRALKGDTEELERIENRLEGTPAQTVQFAGGGGGLKVVFEGMSAEELERQEGVTVAQFETTEDGGVGGEQGRAADGGGAAGAAGAGPAD